MKAIVSTRGRTAWPEFAGGTWVALQYVLGLRRLGVDVFWIDHIRSISPRDHHHSTEYLLRRSAQTAVEFGLEDRIGVVIDDKPHVHVAGCDVRELVTNTDILLSISGYLPAQSPLLAIPQRGFIDVDPGFTQIWAHAKGLPQGHNVFFTVGQNVGSTRFPIPTQGVNWRPTFPPVVLEHWRPEIDDRCTRFSTVADWRAAQSGGYEGEYYGTKRDEFLKFVSIPRITGEAFELALCIDLGEHEDLRVLRENDWYVVSSYAYTGDTESYREFIAYSRAEFSVAKHGYVKSNSGWISDRTACYLASGKPALVQSTGLEDVVPIGKGLLTFKTLDEAVAGITEINTNYLEHCRAARRLAEEHFNSDRVLTSLLEQLA